MATVTERAVPARPGGHTATTFVATVSDAYALVAELSGLPAADVRAVNGNVHVGHSRFVVEA